MTFHIITIFPHIFDSYFSEGIIRRAWMLKKNIEIKIYDLRDYTDDKHRTVDDTPFGGGPGMVLKIEPIYKCLEDIQSTISAQSGTASGEKNQKHACWQGRSKAILFSAKGKKFTQAKAKKWGKLGHVILVCGRYEGVDERVAQHLVDEEISIGDYVLTGGELPAMIVVDAVTRLLPGVLGNPDSLICETHDSTETDYPVYTRPEVFKNWNVPDVLLGGNHGEIENWRKKHREK
jgi:tRNA (guanine37-N1)-methyltransferase